MTAAELEQMRGLREAGYSYGVIGSMFGVSRQRIHQLISGYGVIRGNSRYRLLCSVVMKRDGGKCLECGTTINLIVHHIDGNNRNNDLTNLTTLCSPCHLYLHRQRQPNKQQPKGAVMRVRQQPSQMSMTDLVERRSKVSMLQGINRQLRAIYQSHQGKDGDKEQ